MVRIIKKICTKSIKPTDYEVVPSIDLKNKGNFKKKYPPQARFFDDMDTNDAAGKGV